MLLSASGVNRFFRFRESLFRLRLPDQFSLVAKGEIAPKSPACQATITKNIKHCPPRGGISAMGAAFAYCSTTSLAPVRRFFSSTPFQRLRSSTLTLYVRAIFHRVSLACTV